MTKPEKLLAAVRDLHPDMEYMCKNGGCYSLFLVLKSVFENAVPYYSQVEGHVYTHIDGKFYDITGRVYRLPKDIDLMYKDFNPKPHRWKPKGDLIDRETS